VSKWPRYISEHLCLLIGLSWLKDMGWLLLVYKTHKIETWLVAKGKGYTTPPQPMVAKSHPLSRYWIFFNSPSIFAPNGCIKWGSMYTWNMQILWANYAFIPTLKNYFLVLLCIKCANFMSKLCFHSEFRNYFLVFYSHLTC
jgi:hypothetical protein